MAKSWRYRGKKYYKADKFDNNYQLRRNGYKPTKKRNIWVKS